MEKSNYLLSLLVILSGLAVTPAVHAQSSVSLTSYYPVPSGAYDRLRLVPRAVISDPCETGFLYYLENNSVRVCDNTGAYVPLSPWRQTGNNIFPADTVTNPNLRVGIGAQNPAFRLSLDTGTTGAPDGGIWAEGTYNSGTALGNPGAGTRLLWYPAKAAFRAGVVLGNKWNQDNIGGASAAFGYDTMASGDHSVAMGIQTTASGNHSLAMGQQATASGLWSLAIGREITASGQYSRVLGYQSTASGLHSTSIGRSAAAAGSHSTSVGYQTTATGESSMALGFQSTAGGSYSRAIGANTTATGNRSTAIGSGTTSQAMASTVLGSYNLVGGTSGAWVNDEPIFVVGNGVDNANRSNAVTVLKNGNTGIRTDSPATALDVNGVIRAFPESRPECTPDIEGGIYYDRDDKRFYGCDGLGWIPLS